MEVGGLKLRPIRTRPPAASSEASVDAGELNGGLAQQPLNPNQRADADGSDACTIPEPVTPAGRAFLDPSFNAHILVILGSKVPINVDALKSGLRETIIKHKRFSSIIRKSDKGELIWVPTSVNLDEHIITAGGDTSSATFVEDYVAQLAQAPPLNASRPLFEFHVLRAKLGDAVENTVLRVHHALGDGTSLMSLLLSCTRKAADPNLLPTLPTQVYRSETKSSTWKAFGLLVWRFLLILWYTFLDVCSFIATSLWLEDSQTPLKGSLGVEKLPRRLAYWTVSMDDIRIVKRAIHGTVNDVVFGMVAAGLSRYLQQKYNENLGSGDVATKKLLGSKRMVKNQQKFKERLAHLRVRACILVNTRPSPGLQELEKMMKGGSQARWGNEMGYVILPVPLAAVENPLEYVFKSKSILDKKKQSLGAPLSYKGATMLMNIIGSEMPTRLTLNCGAHTTLAFSNVSGPLEEVEFFGHRITHIIPTVVGQPQALCVHVQSYMGKATIVVTSAKDVIPDPERLCEHIVCALHEMKESLPYEEKLEK
ncbi:hypothetical protein GOP47_0015479 [Adiantum capillus-veneris]|uniref:Diacylglycerol O-acyltransferase n=1 Tax=Adiantum capillus-veneris TaxID=13818 RepID=A0A9D4UJQ0_ADICA|nr:hypothetical protein GOP47_0015479 [Adiantum capillus-veneris]